MAGQLRRPIFEYVDIEKGDSIYIPAGTLHAILSGILICEIQQNSDLTYRLYDWDRVGKDGKPRELHIDKAIDVIDFNSKAKKVKSNGEPPTTVYYPIVKIKDRDERLKLCVDAELGECYQFAYLPNTKIAIILERCYD